MSVSQPISVIAIIPAKSPWTSKVLWFNLLTAIPDVVALLEKFSGTLGLSEQAIAWVVLVTSIVQVVGNIILRGYTDTPLGSSVEKVVTVEPAALAAARPSPSPATAPPRWPHPPAE